MKVFRLTALMILLVTLSACAGTAPVRPTPVATRVPPTRQPATQDNSETKETGLLLQGTVTLDGSPLEGVKIYRSFASYEGEVVAVSGKDGTYRSEFMAIPGDEMVTVWAELEGYTFTPENEYWRHYYGFEERRVDFSASSSKQIP
jgi:hypothetical protein